MSKTLSFLLFFSLGLTTATTAQITTPTTDEVGAKPLTHEEMQQVKADREAQRFVKYLKDGTIPADFPKYTGMITRKDYHAQVYQWANDNRYLLKDDALAKLDEKLKVTTEE